MKMKLMTGFLLLAAAVLLAGCKIRDAKAGPDKNVKICKDTNEKIGRAYATLKLPEHLRQELPTRLSSDFQLQPMIETLDGLDVNEQFVVNYVYSYRNIGGRPIPYSQLKTLPVFKNENEFEKSKSFPFTYGIESDGSESGFVQLAMLNVLGPNFYLYYHAGYSDETVLCNIDDVEALLDHLDLMAFGIKPDLLVKARALTLDSIDPSVRFENKNEDVTVQLLLFSKWKGFFRREITFTRSFPHRITKQQDTLLIPYDCGVVY